MTFKKALLSAGLAVLACAAFLAPASADVLTDDEADAYRAGQIVISKTCVPTLAACNVCVAGVRCTSNSILRGCGVLVGVHPPCVKFDVDCGLTQVYRFPNCSGVPIIGGTCLRKTC